MTLRLDASQARRLEAVAEADGMSVAETVRTAIEGHIAARRGDPEFQERLRRAIDEHRDILERLAE